MQRVDIAYATISLPLCMLGVFFHEFVLSADFFQN